MNSYNRNTEKKYPLLVHENFFHISPEDIRKYKTPKQLKISEGNYFIKIVDARCITNKDGKKILEVLYDLRDEGVYYNIVNDLVKDHIAVSVKHLKLSHAIDSKYYKHFVLHMQLLLGIEVGSSFSIKDIVDKTEIAHLAYNKRDDTYHFDSRIVCSTEDMIAIHRSKNNK